MGVLSPRVGEGTYLNESSELILDEPLDFLILIDDLSQHELFETRFFSSPNWRDARPNAPPGKI